MLGVDSVNYGLARHVFLWSAKRVSGLHIEHPVQNAVSERLRATRWLLKDWLRRIVSYT
jgi:hypothetical protein